MDAAPSATSPSQCLARGGAGVEDAVRLLGQVGHVDFFLESSGDADGDGQILAGHSWSSAARQALFQHSSVIPLGKPPDGGPLFTWCAWVTFLAQ